MKKKRIDWLYAFITAVILTVVGALALTACGSDNNDDEPENPADNLPAEAKAFIGCWDLDYDSPKGEWTSYDGPVMYFEDGVVLRFKSYAYHAGLGYWAYDASTKRLATTINDLFDITLSNNQAWTGVALTVSSNVTVTVRAERLSDEKAIEMLAPLCVWFYDEQAQSLGNALNDALSKEKLDAYVSKTSYSKYLQNEHFFSLKLSPENLTYTIYFNFKEKQENGKYKSYEWTLIEGSCQVKNLYNSKKCKVELNEDYFETKSFPLYFEELYK